LKHYLLEFNWYRAITQCTRTVNVLTIKLGIQLSVSVFLCGGAWHGQTVEWIKMPLGKEVGLGTGYIVLDGDPVGMQRPTAAPSHFSAHVYCGQTVAHLSNCWALVSTFESHLGNVSFDIVSGDIFVLWARGKLYWTDAGELV